ncbi:DUF3102 domain-containing protein [Flavonifractor sp. An4]|uniref:DUF3102 domain-containing protein n=1 Tax=Flavonifractor sp. An4 TaxID=1965634 RepID=UPI000B39D4F8|nr:DUF3102 domain-containing protein [Flavonifractor sp. An4]OUO10326.1 hypothetical protein B5F94_14565 [Flavonifractor sp. An4]
MSKADTLAAMMQESMVHSVQSAQRTIETITSEILELKKQAGKALLGIGQRLIEAKETLPHGEWLPWLTERVEFSERTAQYYMQLAREWTNPQSIADLGATKAFKLLALPPEEREAFIQDHNVVDMSARELAQAIKERDEARMAVKQAEADQHAAEQARDKMAEDMRLLNARLAGVREDREQAMENVARLEAELADLKAKPVDVAVETVVDQAAIDKARADAIAEMQAKLDKAKEAAAKARDKQKQAEASVEILKRSLEERDKSDKQATIAGDKELAQFEVLFNQGQELANKLHGLLLKARGREDQTAAHGMEKALKALADAIGRCAE